MTTTTEFKPIPLPDYVELPIEEMRRQAKLFYDMIRKRHTVRDFSSKPVPRAIIEQCM
jgi:iodotyrosine deiodinase